MTTPVTYKNICFNLPTYGDSKIWGSLHWDALNSIAENIPCEECSEETKSFLSFYRDYVNQKTGKPLFDENNYTNWVNKLSPANNVPMSENKSTLLFAGMIFFIGIVFYFAIIKK